MIVVLADDLTGAAELGGIGLRYNLDIEINMSVNPQSKANFLIVSTDTRSMSSEKASVEAAKAIEKVQRLKPDIIFKKVDSVLRGHVLPELTAQMEQLNLQKALLVPANPALGRTLTKGTYYIDDRPIHLSGFSKDLEFAIKSSNVKEMLHANGTPVHVVSHQEPMPETGIVVGEAKTTSDLNTWASKIEKNMLLAGAAGFFTAILDTLHKERKVEVENEETAFGKPALFVCGTAFGKSVDAIKKVKKKGGPVSYMPKEIIVSSNPADYHYQKWADEVVSLLASHGKAIIAINEESTKDITVDTGDLRLKTAHAVETILDKVYIRELLVEGGSTASTIIKKLGFNRFFPIRELMPGVIRMSVEGKDDFYLTLKPGSYDWPTNIWKF
jgi:D-threonate/D-erythronate kinase